MEAPPFVYVIYIRAAPEAIWKGLVEPELTRQYWMHDNESDWQPGSRWIHRRNDALGTVDIAGDVVESDPPHRLVLTWVEPKNEVKPDETSQVTFELEPQAWPGGPWTCLRIEHAKLDPESEMFARVSDGWPVLMSGLKTLLETRAHA